MTRALTGSMREPIWFPSEIAGRVKSAKRIREVMRTGGLLAPKSVDWTDFFRPIQQIANNCTNASQAQCVFMWLGIAGRHPVNFPDQARQYWYARVRQGTQATDLGTYTSYGWWAGDKFGYGVEDPRSFRDRVFSPPLDIDDYRALNVSVSRYQIFDTGTRLIDRICDSLASGHPVQLSLAVERSFLEPYGPDIIDAPTQPLSLGHAVTAIGYGPDPNDPTKRVIKIGHSGGSSWRKDGTAYITERYGMTSFSVWAVDGVQGWQ